MRLGGLYAAETDYGGVMPDNNVVETAWSPPSLARLSVRSHRDDVTPCMHMCCKYADKKNNKNKTQINATRQAGGRYQFIFTELLVAFTHRSQWQLTLKLFCSKAK